MTLSVDGLEGGYGGVQVLRGVSLSVAPGEVHALIGRNGAGKTTTLKAIMGLLKPTAGRIDLDGTALTDLPAHEIPRLGLGYVPQGRRLFAELTVAENIDIGLFARGNGEATRQRLLGLFPLLRTEDSGASWSPYRPAGYANVSAIEGEGAFAASGTCLALDARGGVWVGTAKGGRVLRFGPDQSSAVVTPVVRDLPSAGIATVAFRSEVIGLVAGGDLSRPNDFTDNVAITRDGGRTWALTGRPSFPGSVYGLAYLPSRPGTVVAVGPRGASWSSDDGATWRALDSGNYWGIGFSRTGIGWLTGPDGSIVRVTF